MFTLSIDYRGEEDVGYGEDFVGKGHGMVPANAEPDANDNDRTYMRKTDRNQSKRTGRSAANPAHREVAFILSSPEAEEVYLCGDFNQWIPRSLLMVRHDKDRWWEKRLVLAPGRYEYKFIVNGVWIHNPDAPKNVPNIYGSLNSVMEVQP